MLVGKVKKLWNKFKTIITLWTPKILRLVYNLFMPIILLIKEFVVHICSRIVLFLQITISVLSDVAIWSVLALEKCGHKFYYFLVKVLSILTLDFYFNAMAWFCAKIKNFYSAVLASLLKLSLRFGVRGVKYLVIFTIVSFVFYMYYNFGAPTSLFISEFLSSFTKFKTNLTICFNLVESELSIAAGFCFYLFMVIALTISTFYFGVNGVYQASIIAIFVFWLTQLNSLNSILFNNKFYFYRSDFSFNIFNSVDFDFSLSVDYIGFGFLFLTTTIGLCAIVYSLAYFKNEPHADRFVLCLNWFILSMSLLVIADNTFIMFLGWELIGLTSFLLINFWTLRRGTLKSAFKAFTFNKLSDLFLLFFIIYMVRLTGTASMLLWIQYLNVFESFDLIELAKPAIFLIAAASIKSAQFIGHLWLPDSMEAPIPASALIHSATLVSAGVYLLMRMELLLQLTYTNYIVGLLGAFTALYGAVVSSAQTDAKKLLAYSTISHCGFLFVTIYIGDSSLTLVYLYLHGFFKALTFFCVGNLLKLSRGYQDTRRMGQFAQFLPVESILLVFCASNLGGLPFTVGFFYKHLLQSLFTSCNFFLLISGFLLPAMLVSIIYVFRLVFYSLFDYKKGVEATYSQLTFVNLNKRQYSNTTAIGIIFIFFMAVFAYYYYFLYLQYVTTTSPIHSSTFILENNKNPTSSLTSIAYFTLFSSLFAGIVYTLVYIECRAEFSSLKKKYYFIFMSTFLFIVNVLLCLIYKCEVKYVLSRPIKLILMLGSLPINQIF